MSNHDEFFNELKEWSARKLAIVQKYLDGFTKILGSFGKGCVYYIDGFAGRGTYQRGEKGSPVLAAEIAQRFRDEGKPYSLYCINIEKDYNNFVNLNFETSRFNNLVSNFLGSFTENLGSILQSIGDCPAFFFLDDFGVSGTEWEAVEKLVKRKAPTDLWIRFDHQTVRRLDGFFDSSAKSAKLRFSRLHHLYGINNQELLHQRLDGSTPEIRVRNALYLYLERLEETFNLSHKKGYAAAYPIVSLDEQRKYHLVFACAHPRAAILASDIVNMAEENFQREVQEFRERQSRQLTLFSMDPTQDEIFIDKVQRLKQAIWQSCRGQVLTRADVHYRMICIGDKVLFGKIRGMHLTKALESFKEEEPPKISHTGPLSNSATKITFSQ